MPSWLSWMFDNAGGLKVSGWDIAIIVAYLVGIVGIGCWAGLRRKKHEGDTYFLGGRNLTWPVIGTALFASNISTVHMVSFAECGYKSGLVYGNFEWMAPFTLICLSLFFAPFYIRSNVATLPDFLEKRYSRGCRDWFAILSIIAAVLVHIGFAFFTGALVLNGMFGINLNVCIVVAACLAGIYTIVGGLLAVMVTESIQTVILLTGAICITLIGLFGFHYGDIAIEGIGGLSGLREAVHPVNLSMVRPGTDPTGLSLWAVIMGYPIIGLWYWCCDQVIVQRVLAAKDENHARVGPLFTGFIKILPVFIFVLPGVICLGLIQKGIYTDTLENPKTALTYLINHILPVGLKGVMAAALLAAMMGSVSAALNSIATIFSYDIVKRWWPATSDRKLVRAGRIATFAAMVLSIAWSPLVGMAEETIFQALTDIICYMAPPITAVFLVGVFWRRGSSTAALITMLSQFAIGVAVFLLGWFKSYTKWETNSMITSWCMFWISVATMIVCSYLFPHKHTPESESLVWKSLLEPLRGKSWRFLGNYRVIAFLLFVTMIGLYWCFSGGTPYYPVLVKVVTADDKPVQGIKVTVQDPALQRETRDATDKEGIGGYGTVRKAGGASEGTECRVLIEVPEVVKIKGQETKLSAPKGLDALVIKVKPERNEISCQLDNEGRLKIVEEPAKESGK